MIFEGFVGPSYHMDSISYDCQRTINLYLLASETGTSKSRMALRGTPGLEEFSVLGGGPIRGGIEAAGRCFFISGGSLYEIDSDGEETNHGDLLTTTSRCTIHFNGTQLFIVDGTYGYTFTLSTDTFAQITDVHFPSPAVFGAFHDNYFIVVKGGTSQFYISAIGDGTAWDPLDFTSVESAPDDLVGVVSDGTSLWLLGKTTIEVYQNTGAAAFPFERVPGGIIQTGCAAPHTALIFDNALTWMGQDDKGGGIVWRANGFSSATRMSTEAIEKIIAESTSPTESYALTYYEQGHAFYGLQINGLETTPYCDATVGNKWHERIFKNPSTGGDEQHRAACHVYFDNKNLVGDRTNGKIYRQALNIYSDDGDPIIRKRIAPHLQDEKRFLTHSSFQLDMETGVGLTTGQGSDPQVMMTYSDDGGHTWSNERWCGFGATGEYGKIVEWTRNGSSRDRVYQIAISDPVFVQINQAYLNAR